MLPNHNKQILEEMQRNWLRWAPTAPSRTTVSTECRSCNRSSDRRGVIRLFKAMPFTRLRDLRSYLCKTFKAKLTAANCICECTIISPGASTTKPTTTSFFYQPKPIASRSETVRRSSLRTGRVSAVRSRVGILPCRQEFRGKEGMLALIRKTKK